MHDTFRKGLAFLAAAVIAFLPAAPAFGAAGDAFKTSSPIKHVVVIFQENVSFDHYFGTYPKAANTSGPRFDADHHTPTVNNLATTKGLAGAGTLLTNNPNKDDAGHQVNPRRLDPANLND